MGRTERGRGIEREGRELERDTEGDERSYNSIQYTLSSYSSQ